MLTLRLIKNLLTVLNVFAAIDLCSRTQSLLINSAFSNVANSTPDSGVDRKLKQQAGQKVANFRRKELWMLKFLIFFP